jgi:hypothetical protein
MLLSLIALSTAVMANQYSESLLFSARFTGDQEVPPVNTTATGVGTFFLNANRDSLCISITAIDLSGPIVGAHIHTGVAGTNGPVLVNFTDNINGNQIQATVTGEDLTSDLIASMLREELYFNIHTDANPGGEIRGQILLEADRAFHADLEGAQEVPEAMTPGLGLANFNLSKAGNRVNYEVVVDGLSGPIQMAHLHNAPMGSNGPVVVNLTDGINGNRISGSFNPLDFDNLLTEMMAGNIYINVHTADFPAGEVRGQLEMAMGIVHDASLDTEQEIPAPMGANGNGLAQISLNETLDELTYKIQLEGLTGPAIGAHFHEGFFGETGGVLINLTGDINGNRIEGSISGEALTTENINKFLSGGIYLNIHTDMNGAGEIRGQVFKLARDGYTYTLTGDQEVPAVMTDGMGTGMASIDRDASNVHFMMAYNELSGPQAMAHFHMGSPGENGGVIFNLSPFFSQTSSSDAAFGYWTDMDMDTPFDMAAADAFKNEMVYVNIHTSENPSGELRGDVNGGLICSSLSLGIFSSPEVQALSMYPNPASDFVRISLPDNARGQLRLTLTDITGKLIDERIFGTAGPQEFNYQLSNQTTGIYFLNLYSDDSVYTGKLVVR